MGGLIAWLAGCAPRRRRIDTEAVQAELQAAAAGCAGYVEGRVQVQDSGQVGTVIGGVLFGLGIVMAGACETGMMYRATEGQTSAWLAFIGNIVGATVLAYGWDHWGIQRTLVAGAPKIDLLTTFGPWPALALSLAALGAWSLAMRGIRTRRRARLISIEGAR